MIYKTYINEYRERSVITGKAVYVIKGTEKINARVIEIDDEARLVVEYDDGKRERLAYGEVSVKPQSKRVE